MLSRRVARLTPRARTGSESLKQAVLDAARRLCFADGVDGITARRIARDVGCSATAIYLYYRNLDDVMHHLRMEGHALLAEYFQRVDAVLPPVERLLEMGKAYYRFGTEHPRYYELMFLSRFEELPRRDFVQREISTLLIVRDVVSEGVRTGEVRSDLDPMILANGLWAKMHGLTSLAIAGLLVQTAPGQADTLLEAVLDGVARWVRPQA
jgi:AcrR family transcriptional regulator